MDDISMENAILAQLRFGIDDIAKQMELIEQMAKQTALKAQEAFRNTSLLAPGNTQQMTAQAAMVNQITAQGEAKKAAIVAEGEAKISAIQAKESLTRQAIAQKEAQMQLAIVQKQMAEEKILYMQGREAAFAQRGSMGDLLQRRTSWLISGAAVMGGLYGIGETLSTIKDVEMGMTTIARVTEDAAFNFKGMRDELQQLGVTYGDTWDDVSDIAIRWAQAGYNMADTIELTKSSLLALNTAELNSEQATNGMIAIMAQWGLTAEELLPTIDKINKVADDFAITSTDLVAGLTRSSGAAKVLGLTMNETIAILTTMREATGRTGKEVGNALNSILSFMQRPTAIKAFETEGIRVFADEARTQFRNVIEIFDEMAQKWPTMGEASRNAFADQAEAAGLYSEEMAEVLGMEEQYNDIQQRNLSQAAAGIYRRNYLLALLQNWSQVDEVLLAQENALGYSMKENERTMQTLEKQIEVLKASAEQLAVAVGDSGLLDELKGLVEGATGVIQAFNSLDDDFQMFIVTVAEVTLAVKLLDVALKSLGVQTLLSGGAKVAGLAAIGTSVSQAAKGLAGVTAAAAGAKAAVNTLFKGLLGAAGGPVGVGLMAAGTAIAFIARESNKASKELETQATMAEGLASEYDNLESKLNGMTKGTDEYNKAAQELSVLKGNIAESLPGVVDGFDEETNSMIINRKAMGDLIQAGEELRKSKLENEDVINAEVKRLQEERKEHEANAQSYEMSQGVLDDLKKRREDLVSVLDKQTNGSQESKDAQEALGETERLIADIAQEAGLKRNATVDEIMNKLRELSIAEKGKAIETQVSETEKTKSVISNSLKRLEVLNQEIAAHKSLLSGGQYYDDIPVWLKGKYNILPGGEFWTRKDLRADQVEAAKVNQELKSAQQTLAAQEKAIQNAQNEINKIQADSITGGPSGGPSGGPAGAGKKIDTIAEAMQRLADSSKQFELVNNGIDSVLGRVANTLNTASAEYDHLQSKVSDGTATSQDYARMQELITQKIIYLKREQAQLTTANEEYQKQIDALTPLLAKATAEYERFRTAGDAEHMKDAASAVKDLQSGIDGLSSSIANNTAKIWENKTAIEGLSGTTYTAYYQQAMAWASHMERVGRLSKEQQIDYLRGIDQTRLALQDQWRLQEDMFSSLKDQMNDYMNQLDDERDSALKAIETRVSSTIAGLQAQIDALDQEEKTDNREEVARKHNEKIAQLQKDRQYHELRTGTEHAEAIAKIDEQIAEENRNWQQQQDDWVRDDKKEALRKQIEDTKEAGDEEKDAINENYKKAKRIIDQNMNTIINGLMAKKGEWQSAGKTLIDAFIEGIKSGDFSSVEALIDNLNTLVKKIKKKSKSDDDSPPPVPDDTVSKWFANEIAYLEGLKETGDAGQKEWANQALYLVNLARNGNAENKEWARQEAEKMGISIPQAHIGAYVEEGGLARLKHDERVLSPQLTASFDRLASILVKTPDITSRITGGGTADLNRVADRVIAAIERRKLLVDKAVNIEHVSFEDRADMQALGVEIRSMLTATG